MQDALDFANLRSVIVTARKLGWNVLKTLAHPDPRQLIPKLLFRKSRDAARLHRTTPYPRQKPTTCA